MGYKWTKPGKWFNSLRINYNAGYSKTFKGNKYQSFFTNVNSNAQLKNLWFIGGFIGYNPEANDFYEAQTGGADLFRVSRRTIVETWFESNRAKKYSFGGEIGGSHHQRFRGRSYFFSVFHKYRFNDKFSLSQNLTYEPFKNNIGFDNNNGNNIFFALRDRITAVNSITGKYNFNNKSGIEMRLRHYWSEVKKKSFYQLNPDGSLSHDNLFSSQDVNFNQFTLFAEYSYQFAPGSFINVVWKNENFNGSQIADHKYFNNLSRTLAEPHSNNLSLRIIYYLDYLDFKKWKKKG
jgi:hypothetical protein